MRLWADLQKLFVLGGLACAEFVDAGVGNQTADLVVFSCTPAGFAAALAAKTYGKYRNRDLRVVVVEPSPYCGGMAGPGGIGLRDCEHDEIRNNNSTQHQCKLFVLDNPLSCPF